MFLLNSNFFNTTYFTVFNIFYEFCLFCLKNLYFNKNYLIFAYFILKSINFIVLLNKKDSYDKSAFNEYHNNDFKKSLVLTGLKHYK